METGQTNAEKAAEAGSFGRANFAAGLGMDTAERRETLASLSRRKPTDR